MMSPRALFAGVLAAFVGFASSFAVVVQGLRAVGASEAEAASGLMVLSIAMGLCGIVLSLKTGMPVSVAWSTPGAALLASTGALAGGFHSAVGAFLISSVLLAFAGLWTPLSRLVERIPPTLANAMLAGILLHLCLAPVKAVAEMPAAGLLILTVWAIIGRIKRILAMPAAVLAMIGLVIFYSKSGIALSSLMPTPVFVMPEFSLAAVIGIAVPLFIVTMASQNIPGIAVLAVNGYTPKAGPLIATTGFFSLLSAPFGGHAVNLAAITAAICAGPEASNDPARRYMSAVTAGTLYIVFGLLAGGATALIAIAPPVLIEAVAGLALIGAFGSSLMAALSDPHQREAAIITFLVSASGLTLFGIGAAFWGLLAGGAMLGLQRLPLHT
jgi:benzoate membrane transport protein